MATQFELQPTVRMMSFVGQRMVGGCAVVGRTSTLNVHCAEIPQLFVAEQVMGWMPRGKHVPCGGLQPTSVPFETGGSG
jgi:hypothetical protein